MTWSIARIPTAATTTCACLTPSVRRCLTPERSCSTFRRTTSPWHYPSTTTCISWRGSVACRRASLWEPWKRGKVIDIKQKIPDLLRCNSHRFSTMGTNKMASDRNLISITMVTALVVDWGSSFNGKSRQDFDQIQMNFLCVQLIS